MRQARIARAERARAERRFNEVRKLANSLIFEVHDSISAIPGATATRKLILERAQEYLDELAKESGNDAELLRELATAYARLASVLGDGRDANLGNTTKAIENSRKAVEFRRAALALQPQNRDLQRELAVSINNLASLLGTQGDTRISAQYRRDALAILEPLAASDPQDLRAQYALGKAYELLGGSQAADHPDEATEYYAKSLKIYELLAQADPKDDQYKVEVSFAHKHLGSRLAMKNHFDEALDHYHQALALDEVQLAAHPDNLNARYFITYTYSDTGFILGRRGDYDASNSFYRKSLAIRKAMADADPHDNRAHNGLANNYFAIGWNFERNGDFPTALDFFNQALAIREALLRADPANQSNKFNLANTQAAVGNSYAEMAFKSQSLLKKVQYCREAENWYQKMLPAFLQKKEEGKLDADEVEALAKTQQRFSECDQTIARLDHTTGTSRP